MRLATSFLRSLIKQNNMKKALNSLLSVLILTAIMVLPYFVFAQGTSTPNSFNPALEKLQTVAEGGGYVEPNLAIVVGTVIRAALSLLGGVFIILIVIGGYDWMTAEGNEQKVEKAQNYIRRAIIGLIITLSAWAMWAFILERFISA